MQRFRGKWDRNSSSVPDSSREVGLRHPSYLSSNLRHTNAVCVILCPRKCTTSSPVSGRRLVDLRDRQRCRRAARPLDRTHKMTGGRLGLRTLAGNHSVRTTRITNYLKNGGKIEAGEMRYLLDSGFSGLKNAALVMGNHRSVLEVRSKKSGREKSAAFSIGTHRFRALKSQKLRSRLCSEQCVLLLFFPS